LGQIDCAEKGKLDSEANHNLGQIDCAEKGKLESEANFCSRNNYSAKCTKMAPFPLLVGFGVCSLHSCLFIEIKAGTGHD